MVKTNFLLDINYYPTGMSEIGEFVPNENISPTFWETTQAQLGFNYDSQIEAFKEDLEFDTKGIARPLSYYFGLAGSVPPTLGMPEDFDSFKALEDIKNAPPVPFDPDFNPFDQELIAGYEEHADYFADSKNLEHFNFKKRVLDENIKRREIIKFSGFFQNLGAAFFDPINFIALPFGGPTVGIARSAVRVGAGTGVIVAAQEATRYPFDPLATPGEVAASVGTAAVFGGVLGGFIGMPRTLQARRIRKTTDEFVKNVQRNNQDVDFATHAVRTAQVRDVGPRPIADALVPYSKDQVKDVLKEGLDIASGLRMRRDLLKGNRSALERLANDAGDSLPDFRARLKSEIDDLVQRQKENSYVQRQKIFKDSRKLAEGKIKEIKINNKVMKADEIEALANSDKLIGNKRMYEKALPQLRKTIKSIETKIEKLGKKLEVVQSRIKQNGFSSPQQQEVLRFGTKRDEAYREGNPLHKKQLREYVLRATNNNKEMKTLKSSLTATENRLEELRLRQADNDVAIQNTRKAIDAKNEFLDFDRGKFINSPLFKFVPTPIKSLLFDETATGTAKYAMLKIGHDSGIGLELVKRGLKLGSSIFQRKKTHDGKIYDMILTMRSFYLRSIGMSDLKATNLFSMEQIEWQKLYTGATQRMGGGYIKSEKEFMHDVAVKYMKDEKGTNDFEQAALDYLKKKFKDERLEKESVGLLGGTDFLKTMIENKKLDAEARQKVRDKYVEKIKAIDEKLKMTAKGKLIGKKRDDLAAQRTKFVGYVENYDARLTSIKDDINSMIERVKSMDEAKKLGKEYLDDNFFPRNFDTQAIRNNRERFINILTTELMKTRYRFNNKNQIKKGLMTEPDARKLAEQTTKRILHEEEAPVDEIFVGVGVSKHLMGRVLDIPNSKLIDFIVTDPISVYRKYVQSTAGLVEFKREFGIFKTINDIRDDIFDSAIENGHSIADAERHFMNVRFMYDRVVTGRLHDNPYSISKKLINVVRSGAQLNFLGSVVYSTIAEPATIMMNHGVGRTLYGLSQVFFNPQVFRKTIQNIGKGGEAIDLTLGSINNKYVSEMQMNQMGDHFLDKTKNVFYILNGLTIVTTALKRLDGILRTDHYIQAAVRWSRGQASDFDKQYLLRYNINKADADKINQLVLDGKIQKHMEGDKGLYLADYDEWGDEVLVDNFKSALSSGILNTVLMGTPADKPKIVDGLVFLRTSTVNKAGLGGLLKESKDYPGYVKLDIPLLGLPFQFFSYSFAALNKVTASIAQGTVKSRVMAPIMGIGLAYAGLSLRKPDYVWDNMDFQDKMMQSIEYSGIAALYMDLFYESMHTILAVNGTNITGGFLSPKYKDTPHEALIGITGAGPSHSLSVVHAIHEMIAGDFGKGAGDLLKLAPFASIPYIKSHVRDLAYTLDEKFD